MQIWMPQHWMIIYIKKCVILICFQDITRMPKRIPDVRYAANPLDYKKQIIPRSFEKDWSPKDPRLVMPRLRQVAAFNNNR